MQLQSLQKVTCYSYYGKVTSLFHDYAKLIYHKPNERVYLIETHEGVRLVKIAHDKILDVGSLKGVHSSPILTIVVHPWYHSPFSVCPWVVVFLSKGQASFLPGGGLNSSLFIFFLASAVLKTKKKINHLKD